MDVDEFPGCCGARIISEFPDLEECYTKQEQEDCINEFYGAIDDCPRGKLVMAVLIDEQLRDGWLSILHKAGFRRIQRWVNSNHGNVCNLFVMQKGCSTAPKYKGRNI